MAWVAVIGDCTGIGVGDAPAIWWARDGESVLRRVSESMQFQCL